MGKKTKQNMKRGSQLATINKKWARVSRMDGYAARAHSYCSLNETTTELPETLINWRKAGLVEESVVEMSRSDDGDGIIEDTIAVEPAEPEVGKAMQFHDLIGNLPIELCCNILRFCSIHDRFAARRVNKMWKDRIEQCLGLIPIWNLNLFTDVYVRLPSDANRHPEVYRLEAMTTITRVAGCQIRGLEIRRAIMWTGTANKSFYHVESVIFRLIGQHCPNLESLIVDSCVNSLPARVVEDVFLQLHQIDYIGLHGFLQKRFMKSLEKLSGVRILYFASSESSKFLAGIVSNWDLQHLTFATGLPNNAATFMFQITNMNLQKLHVYIPKSSVVNADAFGAVLPRLHHTLIDLKLVFQKLTINSVITKYANVLAVGLEGMICLQSCQLLAVEPSHVPFNWQLMSVLSRLPCLRVLVLGDPGSQFCSHMKDRPFRKDMGGFSRLERLGFIKWISPGISPVILDLFSEPAPRITQLSLEECKIMQDVTGSSTFGRRPLSITPWFMNLDLLNLWDAEGAIDTICDYLKVQTSFRNTLEHPDLQLGVSEQDELKLQNSPFMDLGLSYTVWDRRLALSGRGHPVMKVISISFPGSGDQINID